MPKPQIVDEFWVGFLDEIPVARFAASPLLFDHAVPMITQLIEHLVAEGKPHLLIDARQVKFSPPSLVERLRMVREWAGVAEGRVRVAMLTRSEYIDPERFGIIAAGKFGLSAQVFDVESDAIAWLRAERTAELHNGLRLADWAGIR